MRRQDHRPPGGRRHLAEPSTATAVAAATAVGADRRRVRSDGADIRLTSLFVAALDAMGHPWGRPSGFAVVATGGYGRRELAPASDLDVVLVHEPRSLAAGADAVAAVAERLWYPLWDDGVRLDHAVRTVADARHAAGADLRTALSLLDARHVAGDPALTLELRTTLLADWRSGARRRLPELHAMDTERAETFGDLAHAQAPDLKEARGGLRDLVVLDALVASWLVDVPHRKLEAARELLLDVRDALHAVTGRAADRLGAEDQPDVAAALGMAGRTELLRAVSGAARTVALTSDVTWRRVGVLLRGRRRDLPDPRHPDVGPAVGPRLTPIAPGVASHDEEVVLARGADPVADPSLVLRAAAAAARAGLPLAPATLERLAGVEAPTAPWPAVCRDALVDLLGAGPGLVTVAESLDDHEVLGRWLPVWDLVRCLPSTSPVHRFTVDRHSLAAVVLAAELVREVARPDLLLLAALLHDVGKSVPGDHSVTGAVLAADTARQLGFDPADAEIVGLLVRHHLLLADTATRRDLDDPGTAAAVVAILRAATGDPAVLLDLLVPLTEADARAAGPAAWSSWRAGLVTTLVGSVRAQLGGAPPPAPAPASAQQRLHRRLAEWAPRLRDGEPLVVVDTPGAGEPDAVGPAERSTWTLTVAAADTRGLLAIVAGVLTADRFSLRSAVVAADSGAAVIECVVSRRPEDPPDVQRIRQLLTRVLAGRVDLAARLAAREAAVPARPAGGPPAVPPRVTIAAGASAAATVLEVRAADRPGLLYRVATTIADAGGQLRSAHVSTLGGDVVDVFYVVDPDGAVLDPGQAARLCGLLTAALAPASTDPGPTPAAANPAPATPAPATPAPPAPAPPTAGPGAPPVAVRSSGTVGV